MNILNQKHITQVSNIIENYSVERGWYANCIVTSIMLHESLKGLNIKSTLEAGFLCFNTGSDCGAIWHVWVRIDGKILDLGSTIIRKLFPQEMRILNNKTQISRQIELPEHYDRWDLETIDEMKQFIDNEKIYKLYLESPVKFWILMVQNHSNNMGHIIRVKHELHAYINSYKQNLV
jgi:hypothetical protein